MKVVIVMKKNILFNMYLFSLLAGFMSISFLYYYGYQDFASSHPMIMSCVSFLLCLTVAVCVVLTQSKFTYVLSALLLCPLALLFTNLFVMFFAHSVIAVGFIVKKDPHPLKSIVQFLYIAAGVFNIFASLYGRIVLW